MFSALGRGPRGGLASLLVVAVFAGPATSVVFAATRGYEMVSPPDKSGGDVVAQSSRVHVSSDGNRVTFASLTGFGDAVGGGVATEYMSTRTGHGAGIDPGWLTHAISAPQPAPPLAAVVGQFTSQYVGEFSGDLSHGVFRAWSPLTDAPAVANLVNLYLRPDLEREGSGSYELLTDCVSCGSPFPPPFLRFFVPTYLAASADLGNVLFQSLANLVPEATGFQTKLYDWDHGTLRLAGILPDGTPAPSSSGAGISSDGSRVFFNDDAGNLYVREGAASTVQLNRSEASSPDSPQPAGFAGASSDGTRIFLTSFEALTDDAPGGWNNLYLYDASRPDSDLHNLELITADHEASDGTGTNVSPLGSSADGHTVYFTGNRQIVAGQPLLSALGLFGWHDGTVTYISPMADTSDTVARVTPSGDLLFSTRAAVGPTGYDQGRCNGAPCEELYVYRGATHEVSCASCDPSGAPGTSDAQVIVNAGSGALADPERNNHPFTDDGQHVFFTTADSLLSADTNGRSDVYEYDVQSGELHLISTGTDPSDSFFMEATPSGSDVFFATRSQLVGWDRDQNYDLYDARVDGGFPGPPPSTSECTGDTCQGQPGGVPAAGASVGDGFSGDLGGKLKPRRAAVKHCRKRYVRRVRRGKVGCVKRRRHAQKTGHIAIRGMNK